ncbi:MAG: DUF2914 domain-containing protein [Proteobacteria bacterium]|nr:DUF2914 domain-containing protein [Pseudomonadota bacterium]MBU4388832.1 DUF2914 domain-containing protein [Pseudomonadota bacterium]MBU4504028.1 DUF2914 domain-containing protein [Pseudomonadota bacterium]
MKSVFFAFLILLITVCLSPAATIEGQEAVSLKVADAVICKDVVDRTPVDAGSSFRASVGKLYCFTIITGAQKPTRITHVWYFGETQWAWVTLKVGSAASWRTWSSKVIQPHQAGLWHVDVLGPDSELLQTLEFEITP